MVFREGTVAWEGSGETWRDSSSCDIPDGATPGLGCETGMSGRGNGESPGGWRGEPRNPGLGRNALGHWGGGRGEPRMDADGRERGNALADGRWAFCRAYGWHVPAAPTAHDGTAEATGPGEGHNNGTEGLQARDIGSGHEYRIGHRGRGPVSWDGIVEWFTRRHEATKGGGWLCRCSIRGVGEAGVVCCNLR